MNGSPPNFDPIGASQQGSRGTGGRSLEPSNSSRLLDLMREDRLGLERIPKRHSVFVVPEPLVGPNLDTPKATGSCGMGKAKESEKTDDLLSLKTAASVGYLSQKKRKYEGGDAQFPLDLSRARIKPDVPSLRRKAPVARSSLNGNGRGDERQGFLQETESFQPDRFNYLFNYLQTKAASNGSSPSVDQVLRSHPRNEPASGV